MTVHSTSLGKPVLLIDFDAQVSDWNGIDVYRSAWVRPTPTEGIAEYLGVLECAITSGWRLWEQLPIADREAFATLIHDVEDSADYLVRYLRTVTVEVPISDLWAEVA